MISTFTYPPCTCSYYNICRLIITQPYFPYEPFQLTMRIPVQLDTIHAVQGSAYTSMRGVMVKHTVCMNRMMKLAVVRIINPKLFSYYLFYHRVDCTLMNILIN